MTMPANNRNVRRKSATKRSPAAAAASSRHAEGGMKVKDHKIVGAEYVQTAHMGGVIKPDLIIVHDTTGRLAKGNTVNYLKKNDRKVCYHIIIERDGTVVQMAPFNRRLNHAGRSKWKGREWCNGFSIGIGMVNPGPLKGTAKSAKSWFGVWYDDIEPLHDPYHPAGYYWLRYTTEQIDALENVVAAIKAAYPGIECTGHCVVSPGRKVDPTPAINLVSLETTGKAMTPAEGHMQHEVAHVQDAIVVADAAPSTEQVLSKNSKKYKTVNRAKAVMASTTIGSAGLAAASETLTQAKTIADTFTSIIQSYGIFIVVAVGVVGWLVFEWLRRRMVEDYDEGRSEPSGGAE